MYTTLTELECKIIFHYLTDLNRVKLLIIVSRKRLSEIDNTFTDKLLGTTQMDRLTENSPIINLYGES